MEENDEEYELTRKENVPDIYTKDGIGCITLMFSSELLYTVNGASSLSAWKCCNVVAVP